MRRIIQVSCRCLAGALSLLFGVIGFVSADLPASYYITEECPVTSIYTDWITGGGDAHRQVSVGGVPSSVMLRLWGIFPVKEVKLEAAEEKMVFLCGTPFGIKMYTDGVVVVETNRVETNDGFSDPGKEAGLLRGDVITAIEGESVADTDHFSNLLQSHAADGDPTVEITVVRSNMTFDLKLTPVKDVSDGRYRAGAWVRDSSAGIGIMTYYDPDTNIYGGLGHGICDVDTGQILPLSGGEIVSVTLTGIVKGTSGAAGELRGKFSGGANLGQLTVNDETGVFGTCIGMAQAGAPVSVGLKQEIREGPCLIYTTLDDGEPIYYDAEITRIDHGSGRTKNMVIHVTDEDLLEKTGGIVQGMSGSPILQNGKLIGAVTHVFVGDPTTGYGIFIENMLGATE